MGTIVKVKRKFTKGDIADILLAAGLRYIERQPDSTYQPIADETSIFLGVIMFRAIPTIMEKLSVATGESMDTIESLEFYELIDLFPLAFESDDLDHLIEMAEDYLK